MGEPSAKSVESEIHRIADSRLRARAKSATEALRRVVDWDHHQGRKNVEVNGITYSLDTLEDDLPKVIFEALRDDNREMELVRFVHSNMPKQD